MNHDCETCKFEHRAADDVPCCGCHYSSEWVSKSRNDQRNGNFKKFLKELSALCDKYRVIEISSDNDRVLFESNDEIASLSALKLCKNRGENDAEWCAMGVSIASAPVYIYLDEEDE